MFGLPLGIVIETLVAILLATTIGYCVILNQRLKPVSSSLRYSPRKPQQRPMTKEIVDDAPDSRMTTHGEGKPLLD